MAEDIKSRLIEIAGPAFGERGYYAVGIREICQQAGANVAAVNYHFGDKRGLYVACLRHAQSCRVDELAEPEWPAGLLPVDKLRAFIRGMLESKLDPARPPWHLEMMLREMSRPTDACREIVEDYIRPMAKSLGAIFDEMFPGQPWGRQQWMIGFSIIGQILFYHINQPVVRLLMGEQEFESLTLDVLTDHITQFTLAALGLAPPMEPDSPAAADRDRGLRAEFKQ
jgi:TetR/AcrR family transcriptional regulator, regulator of cefoperazone and chloramphenicol sensitivity